jgi:hypothetical protein
LESIIAKAYLDAAIGNEKRRFSNDAVGHRELINWIKQIAGPVIFQRLR